MKQRITHYMRVYHDGHELVISRNDLVRFLIEAKQHGLEDDIPQPVIDTMDYLIDQLMGL